MIQAMAAFKDQEPSDVGNLSDLTEDPAS